MSEQNNLLKRLKKIAKQQGEVLLVDEKSGDLFALSYVEDTEYSGKNCDCGNVETLPKNEEKDINNVDEEELMKRVNEDIAKWRAEEDKNKLSESKKENINDEDVANNLMEEERYYLEPLE